MIEIIPAGVYIGNADGVFLCNRRALEMLGVDEAASLGVSVGELLARLHVRDPHTGEIIPREKSATFQALQGKEAESQVAYTHVKTGKPVIVQTVAMPLYDEAGSVWAFILVATDITERWQTEQRLRQAVGDLQASEERFRALASTVPGVVFMGDAQGRSTFISPAFFEFTGMNPQSGLDEGWASALHPDDVARVGAWWNGCVASENCPAIEYRFRDKNGNYRWFLGRAQPVRNTQGQVERWVGLCIDIDDLKLAQNQSTRLATALRESEARFRLLADAMPQLVWATDADGSHFYYNKGWYEYTGLSEANSLGFGFANALHPDDYKRTLARWRRAWEGGEPYEIEYRFKRHDGVYRWFVGRATPVREDGSERPTMWVGTCTDIDDLKSAEAELRESESRLTLAVGAARMGTWELEPATGKLNADARSLALFGRKPGQMHTWRQWLECVHEEDRDTVQQEFSAFWQEAQTTGRAARGTEYRAVWPDGSVHWHSADGLFLASKTGNDRIIGVVTDITERKRAEQEREEQARKQERIAETLQRSLLLTHKTVRVPGLAFESVYEAAWEEAQIGGDFLDVVPLGKGLVALVTGDVTGKGLAAASSTAQCLYALRVFLRENPDPAGALHRLNAFLLQEREANQNSVATQGDMIVPFVAMTLAVLNVQTGTLVCAQAGADPLLVACQNGQVKEIAAFGPLVGAVDQVAYTTAQTHVAPGDLILLTTDGLTEARKSRKEFWGIEGVAQSLQAFQNLPTLEQVAQSIVTEARTFAGGRLSDDVCLLVAKREELQ